MFRFTLREMFLLTACTALGTGWWLDHRAKAEAAEDARMLAHFSRPGGVMCGQEAVWLAQLQEKYGANGPSLFDLIESTKEEPLGIDFEE